MKWLILFAASILPIVPLCGHPSGDDHNRWIEELGDPDFRMREEASKKLTSAPQAAPWVRRAVKSTDPEIANRARRLVSGYTRRQLDSLSKVVMSQPVDVFVEWYLVWRPDRQEDLWQPGFDLGQRGVAAVSQHLPKDVTSKLRASLPRNLKDLETLRSDPVRMHDGPEVKFGSGCWLIRTETLLSPPSALVMGVVRGPFLREGVGMGSIIYSLNQVNLTVATFNSVLIAHGDARPSQKSGYDHFGTLVDSLLVTRGDVAGPSISLASSVILAGGDVTVGRACSLKNSTIIAGGKVTMPKPERVENCIIKENVKNPTAPFTFFELADVGLSVGTPAKDAKGLPVAEVKADTPFGKAGVQKGDTILTIDDAPPGDAEAFRVKLRRAIVVQGDTLLTVSRGGKSLDLPVYFPLPK